MTSSVRHLLLNNTWWYSKLPEGLRKKAFDLYDRKPERLRSLLANVDGILAGMILSFPDHSFTYDFIDHYMVKLISSCLCNETKFIKDLRSFKKKVRKALLSGELINPEYPRSLSWMKQFIDKINIDTKIGLYRMGVFLQTRGCGLATPEMAKESLSKFCSTVMEECVRIWDPDELKQVLTEALDMIPERRILRAEDAGRVSISSAGCLQRSRAKGGGQSFALQLLASGEVVLEFNLETGEEGRKLSPDDGEGLYLFHLSLKRYASGEISDTVRLAIVCEPGKARTVTSADYFRQSILHVFAHMCYEFLSGDPGSKDGLKSSRMGWSFLRRMNSEDWIYDDKIQKFMLSLDLETATDYFNRLLVEDLTGFMCGYLGIPSYLSSVILDLVTRQRLVVDERGQCILHNGEVVLTKRGALMGDAGTKVLLTLVGIYVGYKSRLRRNIYSFHQNVGDDFGAVSTSRLDLEMMIDDFKSIDVKVSEDDTYISTKGLFYGEEIILYPKRGNSLAYCRRFDRWGRLGFIDVPKLRVIIDIPSFNVNRFSCSLVGKVSLIGTDMLLLEKRNTFKWFTHLASILQDMYLRTYDSDELVYVPRQLFGVGKQLPFRNIGFWDYWISRHLKGRFVSVYETMMYHAMNVVRGLHEEDYFRSGMQNFLKRKTEDGWVFREEADLPVDFTRENSPILSAPRFEKIRPFILSRLGKKLISENEIRAQVALHDLLLAERPATPLKMGTLPVEEVKDSERAEFARVWVKEPHLFGINRRKLLFSREAWEEYWNERHSMRVHVDLHAEYKTREDESMRTFNNELEVDFLWKIVTDEDLYVGIDDDDTKFEVMMEYLSNVRKQLDDDPLIMEDPKVRYNGVLYIVTRDNKLARAVASMRNHPTFQVDPGLGERFLKNLPIGIKFLMRSKISFRNSPSFETLEGALNVIVDHGSLDYNREVWVLDRQPLFGQEVRTSTRIPSIEFGVRQVLPVRGRISRSSLREIREYLEMEESSISIQEP